MKKAGIIRCQQTEDLCPGTTCIKVATQGKLAFTESGPVELVGIVSCGGCPGKRAVQRTRILVERGAEIIALASCIGKGTPIGMPCPHFEMMKKAITAKLGEDIEFKDYTH